MKKKIMKACAFLLILAVTFYWVSGVLRAKSVSDVITFEEFYNLPKNSIEVCGIGSSQMASGINSMKLYEDYGISCYSLGSGDQPMILSYYWLKEARKTQNISTVILDVSMAYEKIKEPRLRSNMDGMKFSLNKLEAAWQAGKNEDTDSAFSYLFNIVSYHTRWKELTEEDFAAKLEKDNLHRGNYMIPIVNNGDIPYEEFIIDNDKITDKEMVPFEKEYFIKLIEYCQENDLHLILIKTPKTYWSLTKHNGIQQIADEYGVDFIDFNTDAMLKEIGFDYPYDMRNYDHMNIRGIDKVTDYLAGYLQKYDEFTDYRETEITFHDDVEQYHKIRKDNYLLTAYEPSELLSYLKDDRYDIVMQASGDISAAWTESYTSYLQDMGITLDIATLTGQNYICAVNGGELIYEATSAEKIVYEGQFSDGTAYTTEGNLEKAADKIAVKVNGESKNFKRKGLNVLVYDHEKGSILDTFTLYAEEEGTTLQVSR